MADAFDDVGSARDERNSVPRFGLALSGGGFRATLFHLGVIQYLRSAGLLGNVAFICSVSGGSVLAAHLVLNWRHYTGTDADFAKATSELVEFTRRDVRGRTVRRWLLSILVFIPFLAMWLFGRFFARKRATLSSLLTREYDVFYKGARLGDLENGPAVELLSTSMTTGEPAFFSSRGFSFMKDGEFQTIGAPNLPVALGVAASSAFPPLFPPLRIDHDILKTTESEFPHTQYLADGGIYDNLGIERVLSRSEQTQVSHFIISDAEGTFDWTLGVSYGSLISRNVRASDMLMKRVSVLASRLAKSRSDVVQCAIGMTIDKTVDIEALDADWQREVRTIRTDLDEFSEDEVRSLILHGKCVARRALTNAGVAAVHAQDADRGVSWAPRLGRSKNRKLRLWAPRDWASWVTIAVVGFYLALPILAFYNQSSTIAEQQRQIGSLTNTIADRWRILDLISDGSNDVALVQRVNTPANSRFNGQGGRFDDSKLMIAEVNRTEVRCSPFTNHMFINMDGPSGTFRIDGDVIRVFYITKPDSTSVYAVDGLLYEIDRTTLAAVRSQPLFTSRNWGWFARFTTPLAVTHFSFDGYYEMRNTDIVGPSTSADMQGSWARWVSERSGGRLPTDSILKVWPADTLSTLEAQCGNPASVTSK